MFCYNRLQHRVRPHFREILQHFITACLACVCYVHYEAIVNEV